MIHMQLMKCVNITLRVLFVLSSQQNLEKERKQYSLSAIADEEEEEEEEDDDQVHYDKTIV